ncbi:hypothetical protein ABI59_06410 [Acidobacteria bacterium Mor1]|nr:hypothetical protein ABI59_06410 [Acidobacteria bacterium Mor1]
MGFHTITLGCKLNQFDTAAIEAELMRRGLSPAADAGDARVVIVNTCTVTGKADAEARKLIRGVRRRNAGCKLLVTGCYAELDGERIAAIDGVDRVFGNRDKHRLPEILDEVGIAAPEQNTGDLDRGCDALHFGDRSRAFLRVQEGCNLRCSYCVIPKVRGLSRSTPPQQVAEMFGSLLGRGYREVVLTGVNTGDYGKDLDPPRSLADLLRELLEVCPDADAPRRSRIRLNSLEPLTVTDEIIALMAADRRLAPHLQVPLQSGSETILRRMRRNYRLSQYTDRLERLRSAVPHVGLGADVIIGFPGETDELFEECYRFIENSPLNYLHVFAWSPRPGTPAADLEDRVHGSKVKERSARLRELAARLGLRFRRGFEGRPLDAVILGPREDGRIRALTGNFIEVSLPARTEVPRGSMLDVVITEAREEETLAVPADSGQTKAPPADAGEAVELV